jgi:hypothetical protein
MCHECIYWQKIDAATGLCRCLPPIADFTWPKTKAVDGCGEFVKGEPHG